MASVEDVGNYTLVASGGDGTFGNGNDVPITIIGVVSESVGATTTAMLRFAEPLPDDLYQLTIDGTSTVRPG